MPKSGTSRASADGPKQRWTPAQKKARAQAGASKGQEARRRPDRAGAPDQSRGRRDATSNDRRPWASATGSPSRDSRSDAPRSTYNDRNRDDRSRDARARDLPASRWQSGRDAASGDWNNSAARTNRVGSAGRWSDNRDGRPDTRPASNWSRDSRGRDDRSTSRPTGDKPWQRDDRSSSRPSGDRPWQRDDRPASRPTGDRPWQRDDRPRTDRPVSRFSRDDRGSQGNRSAEGGASRRPWSAPGDRPAERTWQDRPAHRPEGARPDHYTSARPPRRDDDRPRSDDRGSRPPYERRDSAPRFENRDDRRDAPRTDAPRSDDRNDSRPPYERRDSAPRVENRSDETREARPPYERREAPRFETRRDDRGERRDSAPRFENRRDDRRDAPRWENRRDDRSSSRPSYERGAAGQNETASSDQMDWVAPSVEAASVEKSKGFLELGVPEKLAGVLAALGITEPFPIQAATIPDALAGKDVLGRGRTGSGKTLGFGLPMLTRLANSQGVGVRGLVLVPTRELAMQVADVLAPLARATGLDVTLVAGGMPYGPQLRAFERGVAVVVATPGRLVDLLDQGAASLKNVEVTVLDEADHMADLGFWPAVTRIVDETPSEGQRLLFSATLDGAVDNLVKRYMHDPVHHEVDSGQASVTTMRHEFWLVAPHHKNDLSNRIAGRPGRTLVFARTQQGADRIALRLRESGVLAGALHGGLTQGARARVLGAFKDGRLPVLVATDVAARGIHVDDVSLVLQIDPPANGKDYLHRSGRTARAGEDGVVVSLLLRHQRRQVAMLAQQAGVRAEFVTVEPDDEIVTEIAGADTSGEPVTEEDYARLVAPPVLNRRPRTGPRSGPRTGGRSGGWRR